MSTRVYNGVDDAARPTPEELSRPATRAPPALLEGLSDSVPGSPVPSQVLLMVPYLVMVFAVAGVVGRVRGPAASGKPYVKN